MWALAVCTSTEHMVHEIGEDNRRIIMHSGEEECVITRADWRRLGEPQLQPAQVRLRSATVDDMEVMRSIVVVRGNSGDNSPGGRPCASLSAQRQ